MIDELIKQLKEGKITKTEFKNKAGIFNAEYIKNGNELLNDMVRGKAIEGATMSDDDFIRISLHITRAMANNDKITLNSVRNKKIAIVNTLRIEYTQDLKHISVMGQLDNV